MPDMEILASVSEDCTVKLWNLQNIDQIYGETEGNIEPYITLRGHTGPLFSVCGKKGSVLFTGGSEGVIRVWDLPEINQVN